MNKNYWEMQLASRLHLSRHRTLITARKARPVIRRKPTSLLELISETPSVFFILKDILGRAVSREHGKPADLDKCLTQWRSPSANRNGRCQGELQIFKEVNCRMVRVPWQF